MVTKSFLKARSCSLATLAAATVFVGAGAAHAATFYNVNFSNDSAGATPTAGNPYSTSTATSPSGVNTSTGYTITVLSGGGVSMQDTQTNGSTNPQLLFQIPGMSTGNLYVSWNSQMTAWTPAPNSITNNTWGGQDLTVQFLNTNGQALGGTDYTYLLSDSNPTGTKSSSAYSGAGYIGAANIGSSSASYTVTKDTGADHWKVNGGVDAFSMVVNTANGNYSLTRGGTQILTGVLNLPSADPTIGYIKIAGGGGFSGAGDAWSATVNNIAIGTTPVPEPATLGLVAVGGLGLLLVGKRRKAV